MLIRVMDGASSVTYECANVSKKTLLPGSMAVETMGLDPGIELEMARVTSIVRKVVKADGEEFFNEDLSGGPAATITARLPEDGDAAFVMNDRRTTLETLRWPPAGAKKEEEVA